MNKRPTSPNRPTRRTLRVQSLSQDLAEKVRRTHLDDFGEPVQILQDANRHQCRVCLRLTQPHEEYLLFSHAPFLLQSPYAERGPVFIHARACEPYQVASSFPSEFPSNIVLRAYDENETIVAAELAEKGNLQEIAEDLLSQRTVRFLHARNRTYGCFMYRVENCPI